MLLATTVLAGSRLSRCAGPLAAETIAGQTIEGRADSYCGTGGRLGEASCEAITFSVGGGYGTPRSSVPANALITACFATVVSPREIIGSVGTDGFPVRACVGCSNGSSVGPSID
jgi:hypothetical protein